MRCEKCQGLVVNDYGDVRCMNCGNRPLELLREPEPATQGRRRQCSNCKAAAKVGHNYCQEHLDYFVEHRLKKKAQMEQLEGLMQELLS